MGQYYSPVLEVNGRPKGFDSINPGSLKLMEHSWWENGFVNHIARRIYESKDPIRIAWVGDYADQPSKPGGAKKYTPPCTREMYLAAHLYAAKRVPDDEFTLNGKFLVNHDKREYLCCDRFYVETNGKSELGEGWVVHPLPLLTAIGNGKGGGDYFGVNKEEVGRWAWDHLSITDKAPDGYTEFFTVFCE